MCPKPLGCKVVSWYLIVAILAIGASIGLNFALMDIEYATTPANSWLLIGGVTSTSITFRIRLAGEQGQPLTPETDDSTLVIAQDEALEQVILSYSLLGQDGHLNAASNDEYGIHAFTVPSLNPQRLYYYGIVSSKYPQGTLKGKFQTPASEGTAFNFSIAASACAMTGSKHHVFDAIREDHPNLQLFLHMGDFHYEDLATTNLNERLDAVGTVLNSPSQSELWRSVPLVNMWDDHDYLGDELRDQEPRSAEVRDTARISYQTAFPHYPLAAANDTTTTLDPIPIYHAFTIGTVRFIMLDLLSDKDTNSIYGSEQRGWLYQELRQANQYDFVVMVSSKPWIGVQTNSNDKAVFGSWVQQEYHQDRADLSSVIQDAIGGANGAQNLFVISADAHMVAFDKGANTYYGNQTEGAFSFPILQSAALDRLGSSKGGPYSEGCHAYDHERTHQYSTIFFVFGPEGGPCMVVQSWRIDEWGWKEEIFEQTLCGQIFSPAQPAPTNPEAVEYCEIPLISEPTFGFYIVTSIVCLCLAFGTCIVIGCEPGSDQSGLNRTCCGFFGAFIAWFSAAATVYLSVIIPVVNDIPQYNLRWSFAIALSALFLMCCFLFIIFCCFVKPARPEIKTTEEADFDAEMGKNVSPVIPRPSVHRMVTDISVDEDHLPEGVILTGGKKLHKEGLNGEGVKVAVIDSGIDQEHPGFKGQVKEQNWLRAGTPLSEDDHGTHVAGTVHLMAPKADIYDYRVFGKDGSLGVDAAIAKSIRLATDSGCQIINMSLGGPFPNDTIWEAVQYASSKGVLMVCAAGNEGDNNPLTNEISFPASYKECMSVAAVSKVQGLPVAVFSNSNPLVDVAGIGVDVTSFKPGDGFQKMSGTSMASPHVAGLLACLMTKGHTPPSKVYERLNELAVDIGVEGIDNATGIGFVTYLDKDAFGQMFTATGRDLAPASVN